jgi:hypothetical protein
MLGLPLTLVRLKQCCIGLPPTSFTDVRGILRLTRYYRKFVKHYGILALKSAMCSAPVLDYDEPLEIGTDACDTGVGAVLSQHGHPIAFLSINNQKLSTYHQD